jgi:hypothetical protein
VRNKFGDCCAVLITSVDSYQGEENHIVLLSLVRSNTKGLIGFLSSENRVNVALSRAKHGLFIFGNMDALCARSELWRKINKVLVDEEAIGEVLQLTCRDHPHCVTDVASPGDFPSNGRCSQVRSLGHP